MNRRQIADASMETLNARRETLVNTVGISKVEKEIEWERITAEVERRNAYGRYTAAAFVYVEMLEKYEVSRQASDGQ